MITGRKFDASLSREVRKIATALHVERVISRVSLRDWKLERRDLRKTVKYTYNLHVRTYTTAVSQDRRSKSIFLINR